MISKVNLTSEEPSFLPIVDRMSDRDTRNFSAAKELFLGNDVEFQVYLICYKFSKFLLNFDNFLLHVGVASNFNQEY